jgi:hypothetical protein
VYFAAFVVVVQAGIHCLRSVGKTENIDFVRADIHCLRSVGKTGNIDIFRADIHC